MKIEQALRLVSDLESFSPGEDRLTELLRPQEDELTENELELVSAAGSKPAFRELLNRKK